MKHPRLLGHAQERAVTVPPFPVGTRVTTKIIYGEENVVRLITSIRESKSENGWMASADGGEVCAQCRRRAGTPVREVDVGWFTLAP